MDTATLYAAGAFTAGLACTLCLCAWLTPRSWWRRPNLRALGLSAAGACGFGSLILAVLPAAPPAAAKPATVLAASTTATSATARTATTATTANTATIATTAFAAIEAGKRFQVHRDLNLRATAGVDAPRLLTVPAGATVIATGQRHGDWWQVTASVDGHERTGWASSLWLRRNEEPARSYR